MGIRYLLDILKCFKNWVNKGVKKFADYSMKGLDSSAKAIFNILLVVKVKIDQGLIGLIVVLIWKKKNCDRIIVVFNSF